MQTTNIPTVQVGNYNLFGFYPGLITPLGCTLTNVFLSPDMKATIAAGQLAGFQPVLVLNLITNDVVIEMR